MRFLALLRKELREGLPWILLAAIALLTIGGFSLRQVVVYKIFDWSRLDFPPGSTDNAYWLTHHPPLHITGPVLFLTTIGLGLALGVRQFWLPYFTGTWPFLIHRSVGRITIIAAKFTAAVLGFIISQGLIWTAFFWYASRPGLFTPPPALRTFIEGWLFILLGLVVYLGTALVGLSTARWYTTKIFALAFVTIAVFTVVLQWNLIMAFAMIIASAAILILQIIDTFLKREF